MLPVTCALTTRAFIRASTSSELAARCSSERSSCTFAAALCALARRTVCTPATVTGARMAPQVRQVFAPVSQAREFIS